MQFIALFAALAGSRDHVQAASCMIALLVTSGVRMITHDQRPAAPDGWLALSTKVGAHPPMKDLVGRFAYHEYLTTLVQHTLQQKPPSVLILPESM